MLEMLIKLIGMPIVGKLVDGAVNAHKDSLSAGNTSERIEADLAGQRIKLDAREAELNAQLLVIEQGNWVTRWVRPAFAVPFILWTWKVVVWDGVLGLGTTSPLGPQAGQIMIAVVIAYFGGRTLEKITATIKR